jgi:glycosyltransferase involved in cell wall biosynthesis
MNLANKPLISIITIVYNCQDTIEATILSTLNQTYNNIEYIIIDGSSTDGTVDIIKKYEDKINYYISEKDKGISDAFNKGIAQANGYILMLNAGDVFIDNTILEDTSIFLNHSVIAFEVINNYGRKVGKAHYGNKDNLNLSKVPHQGTFVHKSIYLKYGLYSIGFKIRMDYEFFARITQYIEPKLVDKIIVIFDNSGISSSLKYKLKFETEGLIVEYLYFRNNIFKIIYIPIYKFIKSLFGSILRKLKIRK